MDWAISVLVPASSCESKDSLRGIRAMLGLSEKEFPS